MNDILGQYNEVKSNGVPLFDSENLTVGAQNELDLLARKVLLDKQITKEQFNKNFKEYNDLATNIPKRVLGNRKCNLMNTIINGNLTFNKFKEVLCSILNLRIINIKFTFIDESDKIYEVNLKND